LLDARSIRLEALDDLAVDHERRRGAALPRVDQLIACPRIGLDVLRFVGDAVLPKELLGGAAVPSARLVIENYTRHHATLLLNFALGLLRSGLGSNGLQGFAPCLGAQGREDDAERPAHALADYLGERLVQERTPVAHADEDGHDGAGLGQRALEPARLGECERGERPPGICS
jgi:hypothetical protein